MIEDGSAVLGSLVRELALRIGRIDLGPEDVEELLVQDFSRVVGDLHGFEMPGGPRLRLPRTLGFALPRRRTRLPLQSRLLSAGTGAAYTRSSHRQMLLSSVFISMSIRPLVFSFWSRPY